MYIQDQYILKFHAFGHVMDNINILQNFKLTVKILF